MRIPACPTAWGKSRPPCRSAARRSRRRSPRRCFGCSPMPPPTPPARSFGWRAAADPAKHQGASFPAAGFAVRNGAMGQSSDSEAGAPEGPLAAYRALRREGGLRHDAGQLLAAEKLQSLHNALRGYRPAADGGGWKARLGLARRRAEPPQGLYIFGRSEEHTSELQSLMRISYAVFCLKKKKRK